MSRNIVERKTKANESLRYLIGARAMREPFSFEQERLCFLRVAPADSHRRRMLPRCIDGFNDRPSLRVQLE